MGSMAVLRSTLSAVAAAATVSMFAACGGGGDGADTPVESRLSASSAALLEGQRVSGRDQALQIVAHGVAAPLRCSELAHAVLARAFELRSSAPTAWPAASAGDRWQLALPEGPVTVDIEAADRAEGLMLRGEAGFVRAVLRGAPAAAARIDGAITLEVRRNVSGAGASRRSRAEALSLTEGSRTLHWSHLDVEVDAQQVVQTLNVMSDAPLEGGSRVWLDVTSSAPPGRIIATGVIGFLKARLTLQAAADAGWTIEVDNDKDDRVDFVVHASADEARAQLPASLQGAVDARR